VFVVYLVATAQAAKKSKQEAEVVPSPIVIALVNLHFLVEKGYNEGER
jgi:hypothetical protein